MIHRHSASRYGSADLVWSYGRPGSWEKAESVLTVAWAFSDDRLASLHWSYLGEVERGQRNVTLHNILKLAEVLGVDPGDLVHGLRAPDGA